MTIILDIKKVIKDILVKLNLIADYVVEQGISGIWTYRKWNSGIVECWGYYEETVSHYATGLGGYGYVTSYIPYPTDLFIDIPRHFCSVSIGNGFGVYASDVKVSTKDKTRIFALGTASGSQLLKCQLYSIGKWKQPGGVLLKKIIFYHALSRGCSLYLI